LALALALALSLPAARAGAQGAQVEVTEVQAVQVIEGVPLVASKPVAVKVVVNSSAGVDATLEVALGAARRSIGVHLSPGPNNFYVPLDPPSAAGNIEAEAIITAGANSHRRAQPVQVIAPDLNRLNLVLLPVDWTAQDQAAGFPSSYDNFASGNSTFFKATYPLPDSNIQIQASASHYMLTPQQRAIADGQGNLNWENLTAMYTAVALAGRRVMGNADTVVGVLPPRWFARNLNEPNTVGLEFHAVKRAVAVQVTSDYATVAHEIGHVFRQEDDYDFSRNPPRIGNRIDATGFWVGGNQVMSPAGPPVYYSFMGASDAGSQYWVDTQTYLEILGILQGGRLP
jgi:hypothetical protein